MTSIRSLVSPVLVLASLSLVAGCSASASDAAAADESEITGVTDLSELEAAMILEKDVKDASGNYQRSEAKLQAGPCYQKLMTGADAANVQFRRYTNGAAFFKKPGSGPSSGAERPVLCVDVDVSYDGDADDTLMVSDIEVDAVLRYRLGAPTGGDGALGTFYNEFKNGAVKYHGAFCPEGGFDPLAAGALGSYCFGGADFPGGKDANGALMLLVYQYAFKTAQATDRFSAQADRVGRFVSMEGDYENQHMRFEKMDGHASRSADGNVQKISLTPKNSDASIATKAVVSCTLTQANETWNATCEGI